MTFRELRDVICENEFATIVTERHYPLHQDMVHEIPDNPLYNDWEVKKCGICDLSYGTYYIILKQKKGE